MHEIASLIHQSIATWLNWVTLFWLGFFIRLTLFLGSFFSIRTISDFAAPGSYITFTHTLLLLSVKLWSPRFHNRDPYLIPSSGGVWANFRPKNPFIHPATAGWFSGWRDKANREKQIKYRKIWFDQQLQSPHCDGQTLFFTGIMEFLFGFVFF